MLGHPSRLRSPLVGEELATIRADYMALVRRHLPGDLEQASYIAGDLSYVGADAIGERMFHDVERRRDAIDLLLDAIEILLVEGGRGLTIPDVVAVDDLPTLARETTRRQLAGTLAFGLRPPVPWIGNGLNLKPWRRT